MNKAMARYVDYFYKRIKEYSLRDWQVFLNVEQKRSDQPSRLVIDSQTHQAYIVLNEAILSNQSEDMVIDRLLRILCAYIFEGETSRLVIRHFQEADYNDYAELVKQSHFRAWEGNKLITEESEIIEYLRRDSNDPFKFALYEKELHKVIGHISIHSSLARYVPSQSMGYGLSQDYHRQGYMSEAAKEMLRFCFEELHVELVEASYFEGNVASAGVLRNIGMRYEGFRKYGYLDANQGPMDIHVNSITLAEYKEKYQVS